MPLRSKVWSVGRAPIFEFHTYMLRLSHISRFHRLRIMVSCIRYNRI
jgi:hypothetical protein